MKQIVKYKWVIILLIALLAAALWGFLFFKYKPSASAKYQGGFVRMENNSIFMKAGKDVPDREFVISASTKFQRNVLTLPTTEELKKTNGKFIPDDLKRATSDVNMETFKKDTKDPMGMGIEIEATKDIWNNNKYNAQFVSYRIVIQPK